MMTTQPKQGTQEVPPQSSDSAPTGNHQPPFIQPMTLDEWITAQGQARWQARKANAIAALAQKGSNE